MATGIIEVFAKAGFEVLSVTRGAEKSAAVCEAVKTSLNKGVVRGKLTEDERDHVIGRITWSTNLDHLSDVDLVVEAVVEELSVKKALFAALDEICKPGVVLATTTSSLPVIELASTTDTGTRRALGISISNDVAVDVPHESAAPAAPERVEPFIAGAEGISAVRLVPDPLPTVDAPRLTLAWPDESQRRIVALRAGQGRKILYDGPNMRVTNVNDANQWLTRQYRSGWTV
jgi:hypothetical protein